MSSAFRRIRSFLLLGCVFVLGGCSQVELYYSVLAARHEYNRGNYQEANIALIGAQEHGLYEEWIAYDLGTVYYALGESTAAEQEWSLAVEADSEALLYRSFFNLGVLQYELGRYRDAYESFRNALEVDPTSMDAKINLEYSLEKMSVDEPEPGASSAQAQTTEDERGEVERILKYLSRTEEPIWKSTEEIDEPDRSRDW